MANPATNEGNRQLSALGQVRAPVRGRLIGGVVGLGAVCVVIARWVDNSPMLGGAASTAKGIPSDRQSSGPGGKGNPVREALIQRLRTQMVAGQPTKMFDASSDQTDADGIMTPQGQLTEEELNSKLDGRDEYVEDALERLAKRVPLSSTQVQQVRRYYQQSYDSRIFFDVTGEYTAPDPSLRRILTDQQFELWRSEQQHDADPSGLDPNKPDEWPKSPWVDEIARYYANRVSMSDDQHRWSKYVFHLFEIEFGRSSKTEIARERDQQEYLKMFMRRVLNPKEFERFLDVLAQDQEKAK